MRRGHVVSAPHFVIIGDVTFDSGRQQFGELRADLIRQAKHLGLAGRVHLLGHRDDVAELIAGCDLLAHPTLQHEAFGRSIAEAGAAGIPAVASNLGGIPEIIDHETNGLLVPPGDRTALAAALDRLCLDRSLRERLGTAAQATARHCFTIPSHAAAIERVYREVLGLARVGEA